MREVTNLSEITHMLGRLEGKTDLILAKHEDLDRDIGEMRDAHGKLEARVRAVETRTYKWAGAMSVLVAFFTLFGKKFMEVLGV